MLDVNVGKGEVQKFFFSEPCHHERGEDGVITAADEDAAPGVVVDQFEEAVGFFAGELRRKAFLTTGLLNAVDGILGEVLRLPAPLEKHFERLAVGEERRDRPVPAAAAVKKELADAVEGNSGGVLGTGQRAKEP